MSTKKYSAAYYLPVIWQIFRNMWVDAIISLSGSCFILMGITLSNDKFGVSEPQIIFWVLANKLQSLFIKLGLESTFGIALIMIIIGIILLAITYHRSREYYKRKLLVSGYILKEGIYSSYTEEGAIISYLDSQ